ncbi:MAG: alpha-N-arabinofuranosidase [Clostridia bacterium]|nr:alpha-N-arabinofuranosidase [Clostridia bacterium]
MSDRNTLRVRIDPDRVNGTADERIYGHFIEHFHRQVYGGIYEPGSPLSDAAGYRRDVVEALRRIRPAVVRWPGGCFVSAYHWKDGVGPVRKPSFDKAWRVEEPNTFGTDEFAGFCRAIGAEPYICTNAGTGTQEEMSDWVEYCNLRLQGRWARLRVENGFPDPHAVRYWSIGNENYGSWEMGAKSVGEWGRFVRESAKMMKRVDPGIQLMAASISDLDWNLELLREAGDLLDWVSVHDYWDPLWQEDRPADYETCMAYTLRIEDKITKVRHILGALGYLGRIRIAFDEWNLRSWHHPHVDSATEDCIAPRDRNDRNATYTMADAVFAACFLNTCLRNCDVVGMANFAPTVNTRGMIFTHPGGIVLRSTYFVFELFTRWMGDVVVDAWTPETPVFEAAAQGSTVEVPALDIVATRRSGGGGIAVSVVNKDPERTYRIGLACPAASGETKAVLRTVNGDSKDAYNDIDAPGRVGIRERPLEVTPGEPVCLEVDPHSVNIVTFG